MKTKAVKDTHSTVGTPHADAEPSFEGITSEFLVEKGLTPALNAVRTISFFNRGVLFAARKVPEWKTRTRALEILLKLMGLYIENGKAKAATKSDFIFLLKIAQGNQGNETSEIHIGRRNTRTVDLSRGNHVVQPFVKRMRKWRTDH